MDGSFSGSDIQTGVILIVLIVVILFRILRPHPLNVGFLTSVPTILFVIGVLEMNAGYTGTVLGLFFACAVVELLLGLAIGKALRVWQVEGGEYWVSGGWGAGLLWLLAFVVRFVFVTIAEFADDGGFNETAEILITLAVAFAGQNLVIAWRAGLLKSSAPPAISER